MFLSILKFVSQNLLYFILHISNNNSFPKPLSPKEEKELLKLYREKGDMEARNKLVNHNMRLVAHIVKKYYSNYSDGEDIISIGTIGLIKGINTFDSEKGTSLSTYASRCIENEIFMHFRFKKKCGVEVSVNEPIDTDSEGNPITFSDILCSDESVYDKVELKLNIEKLYKCLDKMKDGRKKQILVKRYGLYGTEPMTQQTIADEMGISRSYVSRIEKKGLEELNKMFKNN